MGFHGLLLGFHGISWDYLGKFCCDLTAPEKVFFAKAIFLVRFKIAFLTVDIVPLGIAASPCLAWSPDGAPRHTCHGGIERYLTWINGDEE